ncbi:MAG: type III-B CRISPR module RAMP protein Cmr4 [Cyanobacteria bacterium P01_G01_bin.54]
MNLSYLYLLSPLHTGGASQEGNLVGIARESHTELPYAPSSTVRGRLRAFSSDLWTRLILFGPGLADLKRPTPKQIEEEQDEKRRDYLQALDDLHEQYEQAFGKKLTQLEQGNIWIGDASILWMPVPSLSHGVVWVSCPLLLKRWARLSGVDATIPTGYETNLDKTKPIYLKDAILRPDDAENKLWQGSTDPWPDWQAFGLQSPQTSSIERVLVLPDAHCQTLVQMSLWRQVKIKLDEHKTVEGGFRYEEAIPPDTLMYFPWGPTTQSNGFGETAQRMFTDLLAERSLLQLGGQESLGRGFVEQWVPAA